MTAAVPDPRFRDQLAEALVVPMVARVTPQMAADALMPVIAAEVEARVQAAAKGLAAEELRDTADEMDDWAANAQRYRATVTVDSIENAAATARLMAYERSSSVLRRRAAALASPAPAPHAEESS